MMHVETLSRTRIQMSGRIVRDTATGQEFIRAVPERSALTSWISAACSRHTDCSPTTPVTLHRELRKQDHHDGDKGVLIPWLSGGAVAAARFIEVAWLLLYENCLPAGAKTSTAWIRTHTMLNETIPSSLQRFPLRCPPDGDGGRRRRLDVRVLSRHDGHPRSPPPRHLCPPDHREAADDRRGGQSTPSASRSAIRATT